MGSRTIESKTSYATAAAFPSTGLRPGDVYQALDGAVSIVNGANPPALVPIVGAGGSIIPANDNLTDLGDATHRFRTLYLGTSIENAGDLAIDLPGVATRTLFVRNPTVGAGNIVNLRVDGNLGLGSGIAGAVTISAEGTNQGIAVNPSGSGVLSTTANLALTGLSPCIITATATNASLVLVPNGTGRGVIGNGQLARTNVTLFASPVVGEGAYFSGNATASRVLATAAATARFVGVYVGVPGLLVQSGTVPLLMENGLTLAAGQPIYVSVTVAGRFTNVAPSASTQIVAEVGILESAAGYGVDSALDVCLQVKATVVVP